MNIINAHWEKRNLGVITMEFEADAKDSDDSLEEVLKNEAEYNVLKIPASNAALLKKAQDNGYKFIESLFSISAKLSELNLSENIRFADDVTYSLMNDNDIAKMFTEINKGLFDTDRIYLDSFFKKELSARRYINWIMDGQKNGAETFKLMFGEEKDVFGFFHIKTNNNFMHAILAGCYSNYKNSFLGINAMYQPLVLAKSRGLKYAETNVSSNNLKSINTHLSVGYKIKDISYVLIKHKEGCAIK